MRECCWGRREGRHRGVFVVFHCVFGTANDVGGTGTGTVYAGTVVQVQGLMKLFTCKKTCSEHFTHATISVVTGTFTAVPVVTSIFLQFYTQIHIQINQV